MRELIYGRNPVYESLRARRRQPFGLVIAEGVKSSERIAELEQICRERKIPVRRAARDQLDRIGEGHQGVALEVSPYPYADLDQILRWADGRKEAPFLLLLDSLQDPQNLGTLIRTAEALGVHGVVMPPHQSARVTPAVVSASSGAAEHMRIAQANLATAIRTLKERNVWVAGLEHGPGSRPVEQADLSGALALVVGGEGQGLRRLVRDSCDLLLRLEMVGMVESLNAAVAGSIALYLAFQRRSGQ